MKEILKAFITGSHDYGTPNEESDIDLVVLVEPEDFKLLIDKSEEGNLPVRYGNLNLILADNEIDFRIWRIAKNLCRKRKKEKGSSLTREEAVEIHKEVFAILGTPNKADIASEGHGLERIGRSLRKELYKE